MINIGAQHRTNNTTTATNILITCFTVWLSSSIVRCWGAFLLAEHDVDVDDDDVEVVDVVVDVEQENAVTIVAVVVAAKDFFWIFALFSGI